MTFVKLMAAILVFLIAWCCCKACEVDDVAVYKVKLQYMWSEDLFPKEYHRKAQWSQVFGQSHNSSYALYRIGDVSKNSVHEFLQFGTLDPLLEEGEGETKTYDQFTAPPVDEGQGNTESIFFVDGGHSLVSLISKMLPSDEWFVGVDSLDLCLHSSWVEQVALDLEPLDAGSNGNNDQNPKPVQKIPIHHQNYVNLEFSNRHPRNIQPIAKVDFTKIREYSTKELNDLARRELFAKMKPRKQHWALSNDEAVYARKEEMTTKNNEELLKDLEEDPVGTPKPNNPDNNVLVVTKAPFFMEEQSPELDNMDEVVLAVANGKRLGLGKHLPRHFRSRLHHAINKGRGKDCVVSAWSDWSSCPNPCAQKTRVRTVVQRNKRDGRPCPTLVEKQTCGRCVRGDGDYVW